MKTRILFSLFLSSLRYSRSQTCIQEELTLDKDLKLRITSNNGSVLKGSLGLRLDNNDVIKNCKKVDAKGSRLTCLDENEEERLTISKIESSIPCHEIGWSRKENPRDCYALGERYWYGGGEVKNQRWPLTDENRTFAAYVTGDFFHYQYGSLVENAWLASDGFVLYASPSLDLRVSFNESGDDRLCVSVLRAPQLPPKALKYTVCSGGNAKETATYMFGNVWKKPKGVPDKMMMTEPIWSTWAYYKRDINQSSVLDFARNILDSKIGFSHIEIDDRWEDCYGNIRFDSEKFPDPSSTISQLNQLGFRVTFWVHPFANVECDAFREGSEKGYWIRNNSSRGPSELVLWWNGIAGYLDTTNPAATDWYVRRLKTFLKTYNINGLKFDAGEVSWIPPDGYFHDAQYVNQFTNRYVQTVGKLRDNMLEVRSAHDNQDMDFYLRMLDRNSVWGYDNGLKTLIPTSLLYFVFGYPFVMPDMIGGNDDFPDKELYVRWIQTNALLPVMQFSFPPWSYDDEVVEIAREMVDLHRKTAPLYISLSEEAVRTGVPVIRPLWWLDPSDRVALTMDSEFLVGDRLLVAPMLEKGAETRDIYLPRGEWKDELRGTTHSGPVWLRKYGVALKELPRFQRI